MEGPGASTETDATEFPPLFPEELWYEVLLRYGLYVGAVFQLVCILAVIVLPPLKEGPESLTGVNTSNFDKFRTRNFQNAMYIFSFIT